MRISAVPSRLMLPSFTSPIALLFYGYATGVFSSRKQARAKERFEREQAEFADKQAKREARAKETGKKPGVDVDTHLIVEQHVTQHLNDKQEIEPALAAIDDLPDALGEAENLLAATGYFSAANVEKCLKANPVPFIPPFGAKTQPSAVRRGPLLLRCKLVAQRVTSHPRT